MAVADVPDAPLSTVGVGVAGLDCLNPLGAGVTLPTVSGLAGEGAAVAGGPDFVCLVDGHGSFRFDAVSLQGRGGIEGGCGHPADRHMPCLRSARAIAPS